MDRPIEIIAEIGINHGGNMEIAFDLILKCRDAGADVAKFQLYDPRKRPDILTHPWREVLLKSSLTKEQVFDLKAECDWRRIEFLASCFDVERVGWCEEAGVERYKIASKSVYDMPLAEAIAATGKPVIVSMGMAEPGNIPSIWKVKRDFQQIRTLYCVSKYPAAIDDIDFEALSFCTGFSDHTLGVDAAIMAMAKGSKIIEKHITVDQNLPGPDHCFSLLPEELRELCRFRDVIEKALY